MLKIRSQRCLSGFTLLELLTVMVVIGILACLLIPGFSAFRSRAQRMACSTNLQSLYGAANLYTQEHGRWPQVQTKDIHGPAYIQGWIAALQPYGLTQINWVCPSVQNMMMSPDLSKPGNARLDYFATPFDDSERGAYRWPTQPWFVERGDVHGDGNLVIFTNGQITSLQELAKQAAYQNAPSPF